MFEASEAEAKIFMQWNTKEAVVTKFQSKTNESETI